MRVLFFCENANQVHISHSIASSVSFPSDVSHEIIILDWDAETTRWVAGAIESLEWEVSLTNLLEESPHLVGPLKREKDKKGILKDIAFEYFKPYVRDPSVIVVQYNDVSVRGSSIAAVCRNTGVRRFLIQDGFLNFKSKTSSLERTDQNYGWGSTSPEHVAVWGTAMEDALIQRHANNKKSIHVVGVTKNGMKFPERVKHAAKTEDLRVLWADQAILDQNKAPRDRWLEEFGQIAHALSRFHTTLRLHPSTKDRNRIALEEAAGGLFVAEMPSSPKLAAADLINYDVVVTYYSTIFLDCIANNIPCVLYRTRSLDIELPGIEHPLLHYCVDIDSLSQVVAGAAGRSVDEDAPPSIFNYVAQGDGPGNIAALISRIDQAQNKAENLFSPTLSDPAIFANVKRLEGENILVIGGSFGDHIGVGKPIKVFMEYVRDFNLDVEFHLATNGDRMNLLRKVSEASLIIFNGFDVVKITTQADMADVLKICEMRAVPIAFYCHETQYVYRSLLETVGGRIQAFVKNVLPKTHALAVSDQQADWLASMGAKSIRTVYNSVGFAFSAVEREAKNDAPIVLMVGTQQKRKGMDLFSKVADISKRNGDNWRFVWLGARTKAAAGCYRSDSVEWIGHVSTGEVRDWLSRTAVFFLSSIDDPMPLSVGEALMSGIPCVAYETTGFAEFIELQSAGEVLKVYEPSSAYRKIAKVINNQAAYKPNAQEVAGIVGAEAFSKRMVIALGEILISANPKRRYRDQISGAVALHRLAQAPRSIPKPAREPIKSLKMRVLDMLERNLPAFIVKPGERALRAVGVLRKK